MRGVNLNVFEFDHDLTWAAFFLNADEKVYGRYGGRDAESAEKYLTLAGLKYAMRRALDAHRREPKEAAPRPKPARTADEFAAAKRLKENTCIHCHQVYDFGREEQRARGEWKRDAVWVYPPPDNVGLTLDPEQGDRVQAVAKGSASDKAGLRAGDVLRALNGRPVASFADAQHALHHAPAEGKVPVSWHRGGQEMKAELVLSGRWRESDISWRESMWGLEPAIGVYGADLDEEEKKRLYSI